jgi:hypothetical protein
MGPVKDTRKERSRRQAVPRLLAVMVAAAATAALSVAAGAGAGSASATTAPASSARSCATVTGAVQTYVAARHATAARSRAVLREARALCADPGLGHSTGPLTVKLAADDTLSVSADSTSGPTAACTADVTGQLPAGTPDISTAVTSACATQLITGATITAVAGAPTTPDPDPVLPAGPGIATRFPTSAQVYQVTDSAEACGAGTCVPWFQYLKELYFIQFNSWVWHKLAGYNWSYVNCDRNGGVGVAVTVNSCFWGGRNPGFHDNPLTANCDFHVSFLFDGFPISEPHSLKMTDWIDGHIDSDVT